MTTYRDRVRHRLRHFPVVQTLIALGVIVAFTSVMLTAYKFGTDSRQDSDIGTVRTDLDRETRARVDAIEMQQVIDRRQDAIQNREIKQNRDLLLAILKLRDKNPELFRGISLPSTASFNRQTKSNNVTRNKRTNGATGPNATGSSKPAKKPQVGTAPVTPTPAPTPGAATQPTPPQPVVITDPTPRPPVAPLPVPNPVLPMPPILAPIVKPLLPPVLNPVVG